MKKVVLFFTLVILCGISFSQNVTITGKVIDEKGDPLPGASISIKGTRTGISADNNGQFRILAKPGDVLVVSGAGLETTEVTIGTERTITITVKRLLILGTEVVVTALGISRQPKQLGYSISRVNADELTDQKGFKTWKRSGELDENSVRLSVGDKDYLPLKSVQIAVQIDGFRARVLFDYFFYSDKQKQLRGDFKLKLPAGASPYYFAFGGTEYLNKEKEPQTPFVYYSQNRKINLANDTIRSQRNNSWNNIKEAIVAPKEKAAYAYNEVVRGRVDPALMEWAGADVFSCSIYPIQGNKLHRIVIGYDINLAEADNNGLLNLVLPYTDIPKKLDIDMADLNGITYHISPGIKTQTKSGDRIKYHLENFKEKNFEITSRNEGTVFLKNEGNESYFALTYKPALPENLAGPGSEQAIFLLDVSLSSQPDKFNIWLKMIESLLNNNRGTIKKFAVLCFNTDAFWWRDYYSANNQSTVGDFFEYADKLSLMGATDIGLAIKEAAQPHWLKNKALPKTLFLLSDGDASWGEDDLYQLSKPVPPADKVFAFTTGLSGTDTRVLDHLCRQTNGAVFSVLNEEEAEKVSLAIKYKPWRIKSISLKDGSDILVAGRPYNIFPGQKLLLTGRGDVSSNDEVIVQLQQGSTEKNIAIPARLIISSNLTKRIYGQTAVTQLEDFSFKTEDASVKYATYYAVAGQSCSWVMLENDALYHRFGIKKETSKQFIDSNFVSSIIQGILEKESSEKTLGSAKETMKAWLQKLQRDSVVDISPDPLFTSYINHLPESSFEVTVSPVHASLKFRDEWFKTTNDELNKNILDYDKLAIAINNEKAVEGTANAFKVISSFAENNRSDLTLLRDVAFQLSSWDLDGKAYELCKRLITSRPAEPPAYKQIAGSLLKMDKTDLALVYYDMAFLTEWDSRFDGFDLINAIEYCKLLTAITNGKYKATDMSFVNSRLKTVKSFLQQQGIASGEADMMIVITWNTDNTDVDLHVREPNNEECYYRHTNTTNGGFLTNDAMEGFGPETYIMQKAPHGKYYVDIDYYRSSWIQTSAKSKILVTAYKNWGRSNEEVFQKVVELKRSERKQNRNNDDDDEDKLIKNVITMEF
ncbi:MAG TPA: carboxypeptidase-like regulatory domain-containing protein [Chitinophagaceae bacterium]|nr:carboxypeptidase-like regulatory domain-containing protein [Chitinophagaceae bacterium]